MLSMSIILMIMIRIILIRMRADKILLLPPHLWIQKTRDAQMLLRHSEGQGVVAQDVLSATTRVG